MTITANIAVPARSLKELMALARARPGQLNYGSAGVNGINHLAAELFTTMTGARMTHVPFASTSSVEGLIGGQTQLQISPIPSLLSFIRSGQLVALGVTTLARSPMLPEVPTLAEQGLKGFLAVAWNGVNAPARTPKAAIDQVHMAFVESLKLRGVHAVANCANGEGE